MRFVEHEHLPGDGQQLALERLAVDRFVRANGQIGLRYLRDPVGDAAAVKDLDRQVRRVRFDLLAPDLADVRRAIKSIMT